MLSSISISVITSRRRKLLRRRLGCLVHKKTVKRSQTVLIQWYTHVRHLVSAVVRLPSLSVFNLVKPRVICTFQANVMSVCCHVRLLAVFLSVFYHSVKMVAVFLSVYGSITPAPGFPLSRLMCTYVSLPVCCSRAVVLITSVKNGTQRTANGRNHFAARLFYLPFSLIFI